MQALAIGGGKPGALFVGGCVRNALLGFSVSDIDIATVHEPSEVCNRLGEAGIKTVPTGIAHGTVTAIWGETKYEITTLRRDMLTDGRHAIVAYTDNWGEDAARRDFTMNALYCDENGNVYDPTGKGITDLMSRHVCFVGDAEKRISEDYLRVLRFFRFTACYGSGAVDREGLTACRRAADNVLALSRERITQEFSKILAVDRPVDILLIMFDNNVLSKIPKAGWHPELLDALAKSQKKAGAVELMARYAVLAALDAGHLAHLEDFLIFSNRDKKLFNGIIAGLRSLEQSGGKLDTPLKRIIVSEGHACATQSLLLYMSQHSGLNAAELLSLVRHWVPPEFPINGKDVAEAGIPPGPRTGDLLDNIREWWMSEDFMPGRDACLKRLKNLIAA
jgi:poly(A) polymerase